MAGMTKEAIDRMYRAAELEKKGKLKAKKPNESGEAYLKRRQKALDTSKKQAMKKGGIEAVKKLGLAVIGAHPIGRAAKAAVAIGKAVSKAKKAGK